MASWTNRDAREILTFSRGIFGLGFLNLLIARTDIFVLGRLYPFAALGFYTMAVSLVTTPSTFLTTVMGQSLLPALSSVRISGKPVGCPQVFQSCGPEETLCALEAR